MDLILGWAPERYSQDCHFNSFLERRGVFNKIIIHTVCLYMGYRKLKRASLLKKPDLHIHDFVQLYPRAEVTGQTTN